MAEPQRIAVVGTGANGAAIGADLTNAGHDVTFVEQWPAHVEAMRAHGIRVETPGGRIFAYAYLNDGSDTLESEDMEAQIPAVVAWVERNLLVLAQN